MIKLPGLHLNLDMRGFVIDLDVIRFDGGVEIAPGHVV